MIKYRSLPVFVYNEPRMQENGLIKFRTIVPEVLSFIKEESTKLAGGNQFSPFQ